MISIIVPAKNEEHRLPSFLKNLEFYHHPYEIIVVDSLSTDRTYEISGRYCKALKAKIPGRGSALDIGAQTATGDILLFLHVDSCLPRNALVTIKTIMNRKNIVWGYFKRRLGDDRKRYRLIDFGANLFSLLTNIATGDQAIFCRKKTFQKLRAFSDFPLFEDMALCRNLKKHGKPKMINTPVIVSPRRFHKNGIIFTTWINLKLTLKYFLGIDPRLLYDRYYNN